MDRSSLFLDAFASKKEEREAIESKPRYRNTTELFQLGFGQPTELKNYEAPVKVDYEMDQAKCRRADAEKLILLDEAMKAGTPFEQLPYGLQDLVKPSRKTAKRMRDLEDETGLTSKERQQAFDALAFGVDYIVALEEAGLPAPIIADEYNKLKEKFPLEAVQEQFQETNQQLLAKIQATEKATLFQSENHANEEQIQAELQAAKDAIDLMNSGPRTAEDFLLSDAIARIESASP